VNELRQRGHEVLASDLYNADREQYIRVDVRNYRQLARVLEKQKFDLVYHLAAEYGRWNGEDFYENLWQTNVIGTKHMDFSKAAKDLNHNPKITPEEGIKKTVKWMKKVYNNTGD